MRRKHRGSIAAGLIFLLLFMQVVTAAYACPQREMRAVPHAAMSGCEHAGDHGAMDPQHPLLCMADCEQNAQASHAPAAFDLPAAVLLYHVVAILPAVVADPPGLNASVDSAARGQPPPGWPPLYLFNRILRN